MIRFAHDFKHQFIVTIFSIFLAMVVWVLPTAHAESASTGFYLGADTGDSWVGSNAGDDSGWKGIFFRPAVGYRINNNLAIEGGYADYSSVDFFGIKDEFYTIDLAAKFILPLEYNISLFGKLGVVYMHEQVEGPYLPKSEDSVYVPELGIGADYNFTRNLALEAGITYVPGTDNTRSLMPISIGFRYTFG